ncbi:MAG: hypothetical protein J7641_18830 [Cyanobacteria bacterium SID2]|nr:hypothetical protein [Cyanobacteria bacterium SID2]
MSVAEEIKAIAAVEQTFDVNSVVYRGVKVWPLIRIHIDYFFYQLANNANIDLSSPRPVSKLNSVDLKFSQIQEEYLKQSQTWREILTPFSFLDRTDILFFSRYENHSEKIGGKFVDRFLDPIQELCQAKYNTLKLELDFPQGREKQPRRDPSIFVNPYSCLVKENLIQKCLESSLNSKFSKINNFLELQTTVKKYTELHIDETQVISQIHLLNSYYILFKDLLSVIRPRVVFLVCYYYIAAMALIRACRELGVKTIEVQHGIQGRYHKQYASWTRIPQSGYELLPDFFWVWSEQCQQDIMETRPSLLANQECHLPIVGGNPWLGKWLEEDLGLNERERQFLDGLKQYRKVVLVSLQNFDTLSEFIEFLIPAMSHKPDEWFWLLRFHPLHQSDREVNTVLDVLKTANLQNFDIQFSTEISLYALLKRCDYHLTLNSTVCHEAYAFGVRSGIIDPKYGYIYYQKQIQQGSFDFVTGAEELIVNIEANTRKYSDRNDSTRYIDPRSELSEGALNRLLDP